MTEQSRQVGVESSAPERARRASGGADDSTPKLPDPEVPSRPRRRRFNAAYKRRVLEETDQLREPGEIGAYLRREGLYSSSLSRWRAQRDRGLLDALAPRRRGPKPAPRSPERARIAELERQNQDLRTRLRQADLIIEVQKKVAALLDGDAVPPRNGPSS
jgi:transposase-like protein